MVLVGDEDNRNISYPCGNDTAIHGIAHHTVKLVLHNEPPDTEGRSDHVEHDPFRVPERLFKTEKTIFPFKADFAGGIVEVRAFVLLHEIVGFTIAGKVDRVSLLLHVMPEMEAAGCMPESFTADDKEDLHESVSLQLPL